MVVRTQEFLTNGKLGEGIPVLSEEGPDVGHSNAEEVQPYEIVLLEEALRSVGGIGESMEALNQGFHIIKKLME